MLYQNKIQEELRHPTIQLIKERINMVQIVMCCANFTKRSQKVSEEMSADSSQKPLQE